MARCEICGEKVYSPKFKTIGQPEKLYLKGKINRQQIADYLLTRGLYPARIDERLEILDKEREWQWQKTKLCEFHYKVARKLPNMTSDFDGRRKDIPKCEQCEHDAFKYDPYNGFPYCMIDYQKRIDDNELYYKPYDKRDLPEQQIYFWGKELRWP